MLKKKDCRKPWKAGRGSGCRWSNHLHLTVKQSDWSIKSRQWKYGCYSFSPLTPTQWYRVNWFLYRDQKRREKLLDASTCFTQSCSEVSPDVLLICFSSSFWPARPGFWRTVFPGACDHQPPFVLVDGISGPPLDHDHIWQIQHQKNMSPTCPVTLLEETAAVGRNMSVVIWQNNCFTI